MELRPSLGFLLAFHHPVVPQAAWVAVPTVGFGCPAWARAGMVPAAPLGDGPSNKGANTMDAALCRLDDIPAKDRCRRSS